MAIDITQVDVFSIVAFGVIVGGILGMIVSHFDKPEEK